MTDASPSFEAGLQRLEELVDALEGGELSLEQGVGHYQQGVELLAGLQKQLLGAEKQVEKLTAQLQQNLAGMEGDDSNAA
ncbi:MAG: exodeoxyribonuclease VII small subunit [Planctomycetes bacterium]|nr:exodeoxyribonuclease VII small subunit [Planctomycetota bacterium]NQU48919.1 exodeoxyribonuclease VII small subunit [Planctomycetota bacterium]